MEILLLHPGGLGDIILSLPAIVLLRNRLPSARLTIAGNIDHLAPVISGYADCVLSLSTLPLHHMYAREALPQDDVRFWRSFDRIVSWTGSADPVFIRHMREMHPDACIASWRPGPGETRHVSRLFIDSLGLEIGSGKDVEPARILLAKERKAGEQWLAAHGWNGRDPLTVLHPGAGSTIKRWPLSRFIDLARHLVLQKSMKVLIIEGPAEPGLAQQITQALPAGYGIPVAAVPLNLLAAIVEKGRVFIGNDSGVAHLAAALGTRCVVLFGPALPQHWAPLGHNVVVLRNPRGCEACASGRNAHTCLNNITFEEVIQHSGFES